MSIYEGLEKILDKSNIKYNELMKNQDQENIKVLGLTATPERDRDDKDMAVYWARYFGYSDEEINAMRR